MQPVVVRSDPFRRQGLGVTGGIDLSELGVGVGEQERAERRRIVGQSPFDKAPSQHRLGEEHRRRAGAEHVDVGRVTDVELPHRPADDVGAAARSGTERVGEASSAGGSQAVRRRRRHHRMGEPVPRDPVALAGGDDLAGLQLGDAGFRRDVLERGERKRFAEDESAEGVEAGGIQSVEAPVEKFSQPGRNGEVAAPDPHAVLVDKAMVRPGVMRQLAQVERVPPGVLPQHAGRAGGNLATEHRAEELLRRRAIERSDLVVGDEAVLPQGVHGVRRGLARTHGCHDPHRTGTDEAEQRRRRVVVEQMGVVDDEQGRRHSAELVLAPADRGQHEGRVQRDDVGGQHRRERTERDRAAGVSGDHPLDPDAECLDVPRHLGGQRRLAHACRP